MNASSMKKVYLVALRFAWILDFILGLFFVGGGVADRSSVAAPGMRKIT